MTVEDNTSRNQYSATSGQTVFAYTFEIVDKDDIVVLKNGTTLSEGSNYTVSNVGNDSGGNVTLSAGATAGDILTLYRDMPYSRTQNYTNSGDFLASEVNSDFDNLWLAGEQTNRSFSQSIRKPITDSDSISMELPEAASRAGKLLSFTSTGAVSTATSATNGTVSNLVTYTPAGTGAVDTTVQAKLRETVSVQDFGAKGDGTTDDTAAIQLAINSLANWPSDNAYKSVFFPSGTYRVVGTLSIPLSATYSAFFGSGNNSSRIVFENSTGVTINAQSTVWSNLYFEGDDGVTAFHAFQTNNAADCDVRFDTCLFENVGIGLRIVGRGASFYNCTFNTFDDGALLQIEAPNPFTEGPAVTQKIRTGMRRYIINGCDIDGVGVLVKVPNTNTGDSYINGLVISGCNGSSIRQLFVGTSLRNSAITGNTFLSSRQWTGLKESYIQAKIIDNVVITGNVIRQQNDYAVSPPNTQSRINNLVAVINDPLDYTDTTTTTNVNLSGLYIKNNIISDIQEKLVFARCYANDVHIESNTLPRFTEGQTATNHLFEVIAQIINLSVVRNTMTISTTPTAAPILVNLGTNTNCSNIVVEGNILPTAHKLLSAEPSQDIAINGEFNFTPSITVGGSATGITYGTQEGNYYRTGPMVFATMRIVLTSKGSGSGEVRITGLPFTPATIFNSTGGSVTSDAWSGNIIEYGGTSGSPNLQYLDVRSDGTVRIYKSGLSTLQDSDISNTFAININVMYFTRR